MVQKISKCVLFIALFTAACAAQIVQQPQNGGTGKSGTSFVHNMATALACNDSSGSGTTQVCSTSPSYTPASGDWIIYTTTTTNTGDVTVNVNSSGAVHVRKWLGSSVLASGDLPSGVPTPMYYDGTYLEVLTIGNAPSGGGVANTTTTTNTSAIGANTCTDGNGGSSGSTRTVTMSGLTTSMTVNFTPTSDVSTITGWGSSGGLVLVPWPSGSNTLSFHVCNQTTNSITPGGSVTWNISAK